MAETKKLFDQFAPVTPEEWRAKAEVDLKGADFEKKMVWRTNEGFNAQPLYRSVDIADLKQTKSLPGEFPYVRGTRHNNDWKVRQNIDVMFAVLATTTTGRFARTSMLMMFRLPMPRLSRS